MELTYSDSIDTSSDPGSGYFRLDESNGPSQEGSDEMVIDDLDVNGADITSWVAKLVHSSSSYKSIVRLTKRDDDTK